MEEENKERTENEESSKHHKNRPSFRVLQPQRLKDGSEKLVEVGVLWKNVDKRGDDFYVLKIGGLRLLVFSNDERRNYEDNGE